MSSKVATRVKNGLMSADQPTSTPTRAYALTGPDLRREARLPEERPAWLQRGSSSAAVEMVNVSRSGACFLSPRPLALGQTVQLQIGHGATQVRLDGKVVRYRERPDGLHEIGLRLDPDQRHFELMRRFPSRGR